MLIGARELQGWSGLESMWQDLKFDAAHQGSFGPTAVVGNARWQEWGTKLSRPFFKAEMQFSTLTKLLRRCAASAPRGAGGRKEDIRWQVGPRDRTIFTISK